MTQPDRITKAFTALREQMLLLAERITGNRDDAADAVQDAFVKLWQHNERYQTMTHAQGAGMTAVRNLSIDMVRRNARRTDVELENAADTVMDTTDEERNLTYQQVRHIIDNELSPKQRTIIDLREMEGLDFDDIANRLDMTAANVRVELSRARKRVREIYRNRKEGIA
ncbi:MAG: sigma-70 family RNA polymerase sigma factor [Muribaculaceae bacterium]|nr:sigma-70 family RNA polymerase sigma factor [Muribaculaceae bacterium]